MILLWIILPLVLLSIGVWVKKTIMWDEGFRNEREVSIRWVAVVILAVAGLLLAIDSFTVIPTRNLGVQTSFGKPVGTLKNGFHVVAPWTDIHKFDATIQTLKMSGDKDDNGDMIKVRLANNATADVEITVQWQVDPDADITQLYLDFRDFENIGANVVRRQLSDALNDAFGRYDPLGSLNGDFSGPSLGSLGDDVATALASRMPTGVKIRSVLLPKIIFDNAIQAKIDQYLAAVAETRIAEQRKKTAQALKEANDLLSTANNTPGVLYQNCLDMVERLTKEGKTLPAAFTCGLPPTTVVPVK